MNRLYEIFKTPSDPSIGKALLNHTIFSPSQTGETVPVNNGFADHNFIHLHLHTCSNAVKRADPNFATGNIFIPHLYRSLHQS
jgi:hypothetical protein